MKDPYDNLTDDMFEATEERLDEQVKQYIWNEKAKKFEPYPMTYEEWYEKFEEGK